MDPMQPWRRMPIALALALGPASYLHRSRAPRGCRQRIGAKGSQPREQEETSASPDADAQKSSRLITSLIATDAHKPAGRVTLGLGSLSMAYRACWLAVED